jgi:hypothetical protein
MNELELNGPKSSWGWKHCRKVWYRQVDSSPNVITITFTDQGIWHICLPIKYEAAYKAMYPNAKMNSGIIDCSSCCNDTKAIVDDFILKLEKLKVFL